MLKNQSLRILLLFAFTLSCFSSAIFPERAAAQDEKKTEAKPNKSLENVPWFQKRKKDPAFLGLYQKLLDHVQKMDKFSEDLKIPDFPKNKDWFNSPPLSLERELKGKVVIYDFWTYCCINCIHILPDLLALEKQFAGYPVAFVGVHSAKFENEKVSENIRQAVLRYEIEHPVVNDDEMFIWRRVGVRSWPSLLVVGPKGNALLLVSGEGQKDVLEACIAAALSHYPEKDFRHDPVPLALERHKSEKAHTSPLRFPGKLAIDDATDRLFISDSNHNRIVITNLEGKFIDAIGNGRIGFTDGNYQQATFNRLQGLAYHDDKLYVTDSENHALRLVDLKAKTVVTLTGNGTQGRDYTGGGKGKEQLLSTPWDVVLDDKFAYIAMAGTHQIWKHELKTGITSRYSGSGRELNLNDPKPELAAWSQPSGLTIGNGELFIADCESSTIRSIALETGASRTIVGGVDAEPRNLFAFGDIDGVGEAARLQHALGVLWDEASQEVLVADTYNHRLKRLDPKKNSVRKWVGTGKSGYKDGPFDQAQFSEPSGFTYSKKLNRLYIADTNNHKIRWLKLDGKEVHTLKLEGIPKPLGPEAPRSRRLADLPQTEKISLPAIKIAPEQAGSLQLKITLPKDHKYTEAAENRWQVLHQTQSPIAIAEPQASGKLEGNKEFTIPFKAQKNGKSTLQVEALAYFCKSESDCFIGSVLFEIPIEIDPKAAKSDKPVSVNLSHGFKVKEAGFKDLLPKPVVKPEEPAEPKDK